MAKCPYCGNPRLKFVTKQLGKCPKGHNVAIGAYELMVRAETPLAVA